MTTNRMGLEQTLSDADLIAIASAAEEVISAIAGDNEEVHPDNSTKMCALWDDLNDRHAPPAVVKAVVLELLARRNASKEPVARYDNYKAAVEKFTEMNIGFPVIKFKADYVIGWCLKNLPLNTATMPDIDELRVAFEARERESENGFNLHKYGIGYADDATQQRWESWLTCRATMLKSVTNEP